MKATFLTRMQSVIMIYNVLIAIEMSIENLGGKGTRSSSTARYTGKDTSEGGDNSLGD